MTALEAVTAELQVDRLSLTIGNAPGNQHRVRAIAEHAAKLFAIRLDARVQDLGDALSPVRIAQITTSPMRCDLAQMSDGEAADAIADAWLCAVTERLRL